MRKWLNAIHSDYLSFACMASRKVPSGWTYIMFFVVLRTAAGKAPQYVYKARDGPRMTPLSRCVVRTGSSGKATTSVLPKNSAVVSETPV